MIYPLLYISSMTAFTLMAAEGHQLESAGQLRSMQRDAPNAAWFFARICRADSNTPLRDIQLKPGSSLRDVMQLDDSLSCNTKLVRLSYFDLCALKQPAIVLLRMGPEETGQFAIVLTASQGDVTVLYTGPMLIHTISEDVFRRMWSGHALVSQQRESWWRLYASAAAGFLVALPLVWRTR